MRVASKAFIFVAVGAWASKALAGTLIVPVLKDNSLVLADTKTLKIKTIPLGEGSYPSDAVVIGDRAFVTLHNYDARSEGYFLAEVDLATKRVQKLLPYSGRVFMPTEIEALGGKLYVTDERGHDTPSALFQIDLFKQTSRSQNSAVKPIPVGKTPAGLAIDEVSHRAYVANRYSNYVSVVDLERAQEVDHIELLDHTSAINDLYDVVVSRARRFLVASAFSSGKVFSISLPDQKVTLMDAKFQGPAGLAVNDKRNQVFVANFSSNVVSVIDTRTLKMIARIRVGRNPVELELSKDEATLFVSNWSDGTISVVDLKTMRETATVRVGEVPLSPSYTDRSYVK